VRAFNAAFFNACSRLILPVGQISDRVRLYFSPSPALRQKIFCFSEDPNQPISPSSRPTEGRFAIVTDAGRDAVDADAPITNGAEAYGEVVWS